jgi:hypothetical protein
MRYSLVDWGVTIEKILASNNNFYVRLLEESLGERLLFETDRRRADIIIIGPYGQDKMSNEVKNLAGWRLFVTGENIQPNFSLCDHSLSFEIHDFLGKNHRLPVWMSELSWFDGVDSTFTPDETDWLLTRNRPIDFDLEGYRSRMKAVVAVFNAYEYHRYEFAQRLIDRRKLVGMGRPFGNENNWSGGFYRDKCNYIRNFQINMCFENTVHQGYITEKPLHARAMGCLPVVFCDQSVNDFNWTSMINLLDFSSFDEVSQVIEMYLEHPEHLYEKLNTPIWRERPSLDSTKAFLYNAFSIKSGGTGN